MIFGFALSPTSTVVDQVNKPLPKKMYCFFNFMYNESDSHTDSSVVSTH